jgi:hypothetical protein
MYGIWIPKQGWLRGAGGSPVAFREKEVADATARRAGNNASVQFIDPALVDLEQNFLSVEKIRASLPWWKRLFS